ncbi:flippase [uncultured Pseudoramibacter sp.]|uniref:flippase n=1 Tax=uncultured Pseudoramibacter sp. TaxID=1623493 RepID=UPI0025FF627C|nr:flippase [uncultured Pseudoramibacter sp.]
MPKQKSIKKNFVMNAILTMSQFIFPLITFPYVSRILLPVGTGKVSFATSVITYFTMFAQLGIPTYGVRRCAQVRDDKMELTRVTHELLFINFIMSVVAYVILFFTLAFVPRFQGDRTLYLIISLNIIFTCIGIEWMYRGLEEYTYITVRSIIFKFIALIAMFAFIHQKSDYLIYGAISIFAASASSILNFINARKHIYMHPIGGYQLKRHLKPVLIFFAMSIATTVYTNLDTVMLGFMKTDTDVGYYNAAVKIKGILVSIVTSLGAVLLPRASYYVEKGDLADLRRLSSKALDFVLIVACPLALYFILFANEGIRFLSGPAYGGAVLPMQWIQPTIIFIGLTNILGLQILVPLGKEKYVLYSEIAGAVTDFGINMLLIPRLASTGASIGTLAAEFVVLVVQYHVLRKEVAPIFRKLPYGKVLLALGLSAVASLWIKRFAFHAFAVLVISVVLFFGVYTLVLVIAKEPLMIEIVRIIKNKLHIKYER